jgi:P-type Cu2+ transporter
MATDCTHCGLPVPPGLVVAGAAEQFCCAGCRTVHAVLHDQGLERYYDLVDDARPRPARVSGRSYDEFDDPAFQRLYVEDAADGLRAVSLYLEGVHCTACVWLVEKLPALVAGVVESRLDLGRRMALVRWDPEVVALSLIARRLDSLGYAVHPYRGVDRQAMRRREDRALLTRIGVAGAVAGNVMLLAIALYAGMFSDMGAEWETFFRWISLAVTVPAVLYSGSVFYRGALAALRARSLHMDLPITIGIGAGFAWGAANTVRGVGEIYFDTITMLIFLLLIGRWLQARQQKRAADATELLFALTPSAARRVEDGVVREVAVQSLVPGDVVEVRAGDTVPVDGQVVGGRSTINAAVLSGESRPVEVNEGREVHAGTLNVAGRIRVRASATGEETRIGKLAHRIEEYARRRAPIVLLADRIAGAFVASALALAALTFALWVQVDVRHALENAIALLIVTCPCALGMATPLAMSVAVGRAARRGMLIKGGDAIERLAHPGTLLLDKTGTLTRGELAVVDWYGDDVRAQVAALEAGSAHPLARALVAHGALPAAGHAGSAGPDAHAGTLPVASDVREAPSLGVTGTVDGVAYTVGSPDYVASRCGGMPPSFAGVVADLAGRALTPIAVARDRQVVALIGLGDPIRPDARATLDRLRAEGWDVGILSGDHPRVVHAVGAQLGIEPERRRGGLLPEEKLAIVRAAADRGRVVMVGDGVNDAAALAAATCGVAVHGSAEASLAAADVFIDRPGLAPLAELFAGARATVAVIRRNLAFSLAYNAVGVTLAMTGVIHPLIAAVLMPFSSLTVVASSARTRAFSTPEEPAP